MRSVPRGVGLGPERDFIGYGRFPPDPTWPDGSKVAINLVLNYEEGAEYSVLDGDPVNDTWGEYSYEIPPDVRDMGTETHMEFGSRVGIWRLARMFDSFGVDVSMDAAAHALERNPELCDWIRERDHEIIGHGWRWTEDNQRSREDEKADMARAIASVQATTGQRVRGWIVRTMPSVNTRELLVEEGGFLYDSDASNDEIPYFTDVRGTPFLVVPYTKAYNDVKYFLAPTYARPADFFETLRGGLDYMLAEADRGFGGRMLTVGIHSRWSGQAHRAGAVRDFIEYALGREGVCFMRRVDIARFWIERFGDTGVAAAERREDDALQLLQASCANRRARRWGRNRQGRCPSCLGGRPIRRRFPTRCGGVRWTISPARPAVSCCTRIACAASSSTTAPGAAPGTGGS
jgi:peptidoglycan/xylan/chitin deacetylase (PgdA/CDA1 family)